MPLSAFAEELLKLGASKGRFTIPQSRKGRRSMSVDTMLRKEKEGSLYKFTKAAMEAQKLSYLPTQFLELPQTAGETAMGNTPVIGKKARGDVPSVDQGSQYGLERGGPNWQHPETSIAPKVAMKLAELGRMVRSPTDTHPDRGDSVGPKRIGGEHDVYRHQALSEDPRPVTDVETDGDAYSRA